MYIKKGTVLYLTVLTLFAVSLAPKAFGETFKVAVNPATASVGLGQEIVANITVTDAPAPGMYSYELKLYYNATLLNATKAEIPSDHMFKPASPSMIFIVDPGTINQAEGYVSYALTLLGTEAGKTGNGTLVSITFKGLAMGNATLEIRDLILADTNANPIPPADYTVSTGLYQVIPEFAALILVLAMAATSIVAVASKKKLR